MSHFRDSVICAFGCAIPRRGRLTNASDLTMMTQPNPAVAEGLHVQSAALNGEQVPIVGRDQERALLYEQLQSAVAGRGRLVIIGGRAGIGKAMLVRDLVVHAGELGALVLAGDAMT